MSWRRCCPTPIAAPVVTPVAGRLPKRWWAARLHRANVRSVTPQGREAIADYLGIAVGEQTRIVARLACAGGSNVARHRAHYSGEPSCLAAAQVAGGGKDCFWGCLGYGDCERVCDFDAISMSVNALPVVDSAVCTGCGDCVDICPKDLFSLHPEDHRLWVACKNLEQGDAGAGGLRGRLYRL